MAHALYEVISIGVVRKLCEVEAYMACRYVPESVLLCLKSTRQTWRNADTR